MGFLFGVLWITSQVFGYLAITNIGYAVGPAMWVGVTIVISFIWGVAVFNNQVNSWIGALGAIAMLILGVSLAAASSIVSDKHQRQAREQLLDGQKVPDVENIEKEGGAEGAGNFVFGALCAAALGLCNGSIM